MWIGPTGQRLESPLRAPQPLHGGMTSTGELQYIDLDGKRLHVKRKGIRFVVFNEFGHRDIAAEARCYELSDGSFWWIARDLNAKARWLGEPLTCEGSEPYL